MRGEQRDGDRACDFRQRHDRRSADECDETAVEGEHDEREQYQEHQGLRALQFTLEDLFDDERTGDDRAERERQALGGAAPPRRGPVAQPESAQHAEEADAQHEERRLGLPAGWLVDAEQPVPEHGRCDHGRA